MRRFMVLGSVAGLGVLSIALFAGCATTGESAQRDQLTRNVGSYAPPPSGATRPRVGVPPFEVDGAQGNFSFGSSQLEGMAADQLTTLMLLTNRFDVVERAQLQQLLAEQGLEGIVRPDELAQVAKVRGVDYLVLGKITGFRVKSERVSNEAGVQRGLISDKLLDGFTGGINQDQTVLTTEMGVDLRMVDPTTGSIKVAHFSQFKQQDTAESFGIDIAGIGGSGDAEIQISEDDAGKLMRLAFDDALRKMMPQIDARILRGTTTSSSTTSSTASPTRGAAESSGSSATPKFCPQCGEKLGSGAKFCGSCGHKLQ